MNTPLLQAVLTDPRHIHPGERTVPFPIPDTQYDEVIENLQALGMGDALCSDCLVAHYEKLGREWLGGHHGAFTAEGYISYEGAIPLEQLLPEKMQSEDCQMGGLCIG